MKFKDEDVHHTIDRIAHQYHLFASNQFINYYLTGSRISKSDWVDVEDLVKSRKYYEAEGYDLNKLYEEVLSFARFLTKIREDMLPRMRAEADIRMKKLSHDNRILFKMTVENAPGNLKGFFDLLSDLLVRLKRVDRAKNGEAAMLYDRLPFMKDVEKMLDS